MKRFVTIENTKIKNMNYDYWAKYYLLQVQVDYKVFYPPLSWEK